MSHIILAAISGAATIAGIFIPGTWKAGIALAAFGCGLNVAAAIMKRIRA
jgi:hypothetical protein